MPDETSILSEAAIIEAAKPLIEQQIREMLEACSPRIEEVINDFLSDKQLTIMVTSQLTSTLVEILQEIKERR